MFKKIKKQKLIPKVTAEEALIDAEKVGFLTKQGGGKNEQIFFFFYYNLTRL